MIQINVLELALHDPSRLTADLAGRTRLAVNEPRAVRGSRRLFPRRRATTEH
jgi:hypothetical protein